MDTRILRHYHRIRREQQRWANRGKGLPDHARAVLAQARRLVQLEDAEADDQIRFIWDSDDYYENADRENAKYAKSERERREYERFADQHDKDVESGRLEILCCRAEIPKRCPHCQQPLGGEWETADALCGIEILIDDPTNYRREVELEMAQVAGVIK